MRNWKAAAALLVFAASAAACAVPDRYPPGHAGTDVGVTGGSSAGALSGSGPAADPAADKKPERGNTPPGMDRTGHGPAAGAIVDPTGAATRGKPY